MVDKVQPLKLEDASTGGDEVDQFPTGLDPTEDYVECGGLVVADTTNGVRDESTVLSRVGNDLLFKDGNNTSPVTLSQLLLGGGLTESQHLVLRQLIHLADGGGPWEGFASGAYREILPVASPFPSSIIWWTNSSKTQKIVEQVIIRNPNRSASSVIWRIYNNTGNLIIEATDTITYSGAFEVSRTRTLA
jgi:hypothetical protein